jgi:drug/metabolite transporter superfamily protein YnfA
MDFLRDIWLFLRERKKYWLAPIIIVLVLLGFLMIFASSSAVSPFIYTLF